MAKKKKVVKRHKIKFLSILILILVVVLLYFLINGILSFKIQNIYIHDTNFLNDEYILNVAKIEDYPSYVKNSTRILEKRLEESPYIKNAEVKKSFLGVIDIYIEESKVLYYKEYDKKYVLDTGEEVDSLTYNFSPVRVINYIPDLVYERFFKKVLEFNSDVLDKISQIKYDPSEYDDSRFLFYMVDGNYVYMTISKFETINYYNQIYPTLNGKKGILYLDSGNHFQEFK
ncbi:MAG: FtsQ-type POTRA domain-containing protein [Bacilli bacterium]|nr:FtsQ-type POTRA domain-containing protein [Bacilli bacterium]